VAPLDLETAQRYAEILPYLRERGTPIPTNDIWIAATAMEWGLRVLTTDAHFGWLPQVSVLPLE
jgi:tRNA(fMet)-specific endonuclease VapC